MPASRPPEAYKNTLKALPEIEPKKHTPNQHAKNRQVEKSSPLNLAHRQPKYGPAGIPSFEIPVYIP